MTITKSTIRNPNRARQGYLARVRCTYEFDATHGELDNSPYVIFDVTGRVLLHYMTCFCTEDLAGATATIEVGVTGATPGLIAQEVATDIDNGMWYHSGTARLGAGSIGYGTANGVATNLGLIALSTDILLTIGTADVTNGTLVFDAWYEPISDDGRLS